MCGRARVLSPGGGGRLLPFSAVVGCGHTIAYLNLRQKVYYCRSVASALRHKNSRLQVRVCVAEAHGRSTNKNAATHAPDTVLSVTGAIPAMSGPTCRRRSCRRTRGARRGAPA